MEVSVSDCGSFSMPVTLRPGFRRLSPVTWLLQPAWPGQESELALFSSSDGSEGHSNLGCIKRPAGRHSADNVFGKRSRFIEEFSNRSGKFD